MSSQAIPTETVSRILAISVDDMDLVAQDRKQRERMCFYSHCRRVWEKMSAEERQSIRQKLPPSNPGFEEFKCIDEVERIIAENGNYSREPFDL